MGTKSDWLRADDARRAVKFGLTQALPRWRAVLLATALLGTSGAAPAHGPGQPVDCARPALWVVSDADTTIYLFGTFHAHDGRTHWFDHAVKTAFDRSNELVLETLVPESPEEIAEVLRRHHGGRTRSAGLSGARQTMSAARSAGMSVQKGADAVLRRAAENSGKQVAALESFEFQLRMYDRLPGPARPSVSTQGSPEAAATQQSAMAGFLKQMLTAWNRGDSGTFEAVVGAVESQSPATYRIMFDQRNSSWAWWISQRLKAPGTAFVAVGTGHLVGRDSVQAKLAGLGIPSARVN